MDERSDAPAKKRGRHCSSIIVQKLATKQNVLKFYKIKNQ